MRIITVDEQVCYGQMDHSGIVFRWNNVKINMLPEIQGFIQDYFATKVGYTRQTIESSPQRHLDIPRLLLQSEFDLFNTG